MNKLLLNTYPQLRLLALIIFLTSLAACGGDKAGSDKKQEGTEQTGKKEGSEKAEAGEGEANGVIELNDVQFNAAKIELGKAQVRPVPVVIQANGQLDIPPQQKVSITMPFGGMLKSTDLLQGKWVRKGEVIAHLQNPDFIQLQQDYLDALSQLGFSEKELERQRDLASQSANARKTLERAQADFSSLQARVKGLEQKLLLLNLKPATLRKTGKIEAMAPAISPIAGFVTKVNVNIGSYVQPNEVLFEIVDTRHLHAELTVFERDVLKLKKGQTVAFKLSDESKERSATLYLIGREISPDRTVQVHCHLDEEDVNLLPGMYLKAIVQVGVENKPALPEQAIVQSNGKPVVFRYLGSVKEGEGQVHRFAPEAVAVAASAGGFAALKQMPEHADSIVVTGAYDLVSKLNNVEEEE